MISTKIKLSIKKVDNKYQKIAPKHILLNVVYINQYCCIIKKFVIYFLGIRYKTKLLIYLIQLSLGSLEVKY